MNQDLNGSSKKKIQFDLKSKLNGGGVGSRSKIDLRNQDLFIDTTL